MMLSQRASFLLLLLTQYSQASTYHRDLSSTGNSTNTTTLNQNGEDDSSGDDLCFNLITSGDAETGLVSDWDATDSGPIMFDADGPFGSTRSFKISGRNGVNAGPGQVIDTDCLQVGKQYKITAQIKITDESDGDFTCDKYTEWLDPNYCPLFTLIVMTADGEAKLNLGNDMITVLEWIEGEWNPYFVVFTIDERLASASTAYLLIRGPRPGINIYFDDVSIVEHVGIDTRNNAWSAAPSPEGTTSDQCISSTSHDSQNATSNDLLVSNFNYQYYSDSETYDSSLECAIVNGDAESDHIDHWIPMGSEGGTILLHYLGPGNETRSFMHVDRPTSNSGPGQENIDLSCFELGQSYELKAKIKLVDENGFPYQCDYHSNNTECDKTCPEFIFVYMAGNTEHFLPIPNNITDPWIAEEFNEYYATFEITQDFLNSPSAGFYFRGPRAGVGILLDDVMLTTYNGNAPPTTDTNPGPCFSLVISGDADTGDINDWEIKDVVSGQIVTTTDAPDGSSLAFQHKSRTHVNSGPGQDLNVTCLEEGKQYILTAQIKIEDEIFGPYACDKYATWRDPDFCPLFTIWVDEGGGHIARFNIGNDYFHHRVWQEEDYNPYYAIFTVDSRLAATNDAYLYLRGPRRNATMLFTDVLIEEYVGTDTRYNFWTSLSPIDSSEIAYDLPDWEDSQNNYPTVPPQPFYYIYWGWHGYGWYHGSTGPCTQLVSNGDAEPGILTGWEMMGVHGGSLVLHGEGPVNSTQSFIHTGRLHYNSGPGQSLDLSCLQRGRIYEVKAKIKLFDHNGFPFRCSRNTWGDAYTCPMFTIVYTLPTGEMRLVNEWNDIHEVPWYADHFNEFHALFQADEDMVNAVDAFWYFRGPRADINIAFDDVSIMLYDYQLSDAVTVVKPPGCQELTYNGNAQLNSLSGWTAHDGNGLVTISSNGPDGSGPAFKTIARSHATNGPGQEIDVSCLERGRTYRVTAKIFLEDGTGAPFACQRGSNWNTPYYCPMFSIDVRQPWGHVRWNSFNQITDPIVAGWNEFESEFTVSSRTVYPDLAYAYFRGPAKEIVIYFNEVNVTLTEDAPETQLVVPARDPSTNCTNYCCEMVRNGDGESSSFDGWIVVPEGDGDLSVHNVGADGSTSSIKHMSRTSINSGPGQSIETGCLVRDQFYEIHAKIMLLDASGNDVSCDKSADWNDPSFCPLFSIWGNHGETGWDNFWFDVPNNDTSTWVAGSFNDYHAFFQVTDELMTATEASFVFRGLPPGVQVVVDSVSLSPYNHEPGYLPEGWGLYEYDFFSSSSTFEVNPYSQSTCNVPIVNGDFETGDTSGWFVNHGGELSILQCPETGGTYCLRHSQRTSKYMGPKANLDLSCIEEGRVFNVFAQIKLMDARWEPIGCDKLAGPYSHCPIFTLHFTLPSGEEKWRYIANRALSQWNATIFNEFYGEFEVDAELASATNAYFYFENPAAGTTIILDNVEIKELLLEADAEYLQMTETCAKFVLNGNAESGELRGWTPRLGGELIHHPDGADLTSNSIMHSGRRSFLMGPKHVLAMDCFTGGMQYKFEAKMKLIDDATGEAFECDKTKQWIDDLACPLLTFQLTLPDGSKRWLYHNNKTKGKWQKNMWNFFQSTFRIDETLATATEGNFYIERVKAGVSIVIDEVVISRDCSVLVPNWDAELESLLPWYQHGGGEISIVAGGSNGSPNTFASTGRLYPYGGPSHMLDVHCLTIGSKYKWKAQFKLLDSTNGNAPFACDKTKPYGHADCCPFFTLVLEVADSTVPVYLHYYNSDTSEWVAGQFNYFETEIEITEQIHSATSAKMIINGPRTGMTILFDEAELDLVEEGDCENLIPNGHFETNEELVGWSMADNGNITVIEGGASESRYSIIASGRLAASDGPMSQISHMCMYEGLVYEFSASLKLYDQNDVPFLCNKTAPYGDPLSCPVLAIEMSTPTEFVMVHPENTVEDPWVADDWNDFRAIFVVSNDLANAEISHFKFKGPAPGISILVDNMKTEKYRPHAINCNQLIVSTNGENEYLGGWHAQGGGYIEIIDDGDNSTKAFAHYARGAHNSGPKQNIETVCLEEGQVYDIYARFKFEDSAGNPVGCDKSAVWGDPDFCLLFTFQMNGDPSQRLHFGTHYGAPWVANEYNSFSTVVTVNHDMANAESLFFFIQGPSDDKTIIFDNISMRLRDDSS